MRETYENHNFVIRSNHSTLDLGTMDLTQQKAFIAQVKAATHGMSKDEKSKSQELLLAGACMILGDSCPQEWKALLFVGRSHKLFTR